MARAEASAARDIMVTGSRIGPSRGDAPAPSSRGQAWRGDWNACTVDDPDRTTATCRPSRGGAAALVDDGLSRARRGETAAAIAAFDRAIARSPRRADAYLNRGLLRAETGDDVGALDDLDAAIRLAPSEPRGYYNRSRILRRRGEVRRAQTDQDRAIALDPRYAAAFDDR